MDARAIDGEHAERKEDAPAQLLYRPEIPDRIEKDSIITSSQNSLTESGFDDLGLPERSVIGTVPRAVATGFFNAKSGIESLMALHTAFAQRLYRQITSDLAASGLDLLLGSGAEPMDCDTQ